MSKKRYSYFICVLVLALFLTSCACNNTNNINGISSNTQDNYVPRNDEKEYQFDGGHLYYKLRDEVDGKQAWVVWLYADTTDLYIPATIEDAPVVRVACLNGKARNVYYPSCVRQLGMSGCEVDSIEGIESIIFGYDGGHLQLDKVVHFIDNLDSLRHVSFSEYLL